jgi:hypothetical protein
VGCHEKDLDKAPQHKDHTGKVQCQVCHSQDYVNCYSCHTGKDDKGVAYFVNQMETESFKIGLNYPGTGLTEKWILVRHEPSDPEVFDFYGTGGFKNFDGVPTWKRTSPHNIQRRTWRNASCNHCHGQRSLFSRSPTCWTTRRARTRPSSSRRQDPGEARGGHVQGPGSASSRDGREGGGPPRGAGEEGAGGRGRRAGPAPTEGPPSGRSLQRDGRLRYPPDSTPRAMTMKSPEELAVASEAADRR